MNITNQNNGRRGQLIHQEALTNEKLWTVKALEEWVKRILSNGGTNNYYIVLVYINGEKWGIHPLHIIKTV